MRRAPVWTFFRALSRKRELYPGHVGSGIERLRTRWSALRVQARGAGPQALLAAHLSLTLVALTGAGWGISRAVLLPAAWPTIVLFLSAVAACFAAGLLWWQPGRAGARLIVIGSVSYLIALWNFSATVYAMPALLLVASGTIALVIRPLGAIWLGAKCVPPGSSFYVPVPSGWVQQWLFRPAATARFQAMRESFASLDTWKKVPLLAALGSAVALINFWYTDYYEPSSFPPALNVTTSLANSEVKTLTATTPQVLSNGPTADPCVPLGQSEISKMIPITGKITIRNPTKVDVHLLAAAVNVTGWRIQEALSPDNGSYLSNLPNNSRIWIYGHTSYCPSYHVYGNNLFGSNEDYHFAPDEDFSAGFVFYVPPHTYNMLLLDLDLSFAKNNPGLIHTLDVNYTTGDPKAPWRGFQLFKDQLFSGWAPLDGSNRDVGFDALKISGAHSEFELALTEAPTGVPATAQASGGTVP